MHLIKLLQRWPQRKEKSLHHYYHHHRCRQWVLCDSVTGPQMPSLSRVALLAHKQLKDIWPLIPAVWWSEYSLASLLNAGFVQLTSEWYKIGLSFISSRNPLNFEQVFFVCLFFVLFYFVLLWVTKMLLLPTETHCIWLAQWKQRDKVPTIQKKKKRSIFFSLWKVFCLCSPLRKSSIFLLLAEQTNKPQSTKLPQL